MHDPMALYTPRLGTADQNCPLFNVVQNQIMIHFSKIIISFISTQKY